MLGDKFIETGIDGIMLDKNTYLEHIGCQIVIDYNKINVEKFVDIKCMDLWYNNVKDRLSSFIIGEDTFYLLCVRTSLVRVSKGMLILKNNMVLGILKIDCDNLSLYVDTYTNLVDCGCSNYEELYKSLFESYKFNFNNVRIYMILDNNDVECKYIYKNKLCKVNTGNLENRDNGVFVYLYNVFKDGKIDTFLRFNALVEIGNLTWDILISLNDGKVYYEGNGNTIQITKIMDEVYYKDELVSSNDYKVNGYLCDVDVQNIDLETIVNKAKDSLIVQK